MSSLIGNYAAAKVFYRLAVLKKGNTGDIAKFKDYTVKQDRCKRHRCVWYTLCVGDGGADKFSAG